MPGLLLYSSAVIDICDGSCCTSSSRVLSSPVILSITCAGNGKSGSCPSDALYRTCDSASHGGGECACCDMCSGDAVSEYARCDICSGDAASDDVLDCDEHNDDMDDDVPGGVSTCVDWMVTCTDGGDGT